MSHNQHLGKNSIVSLERLRRAILRSGSRKILVEKIDSTIELVHSIIQQSAKLHPKVRPDLYSKIRYLRYLRYFRATTRHLMKEQLHDYCRDVAVVLCALQFEIWQGRNPELYRLVDSVEEMEAGS